MNDREFLEHFKEDLTDLIHQVELADNLEDLEKDLMDEIAHKIWMLNIEADSIGGQMQ